MSCKSMIYLTNAGSQTVLTGGVLSLNTVRRFGTGAVQSGNGVLLSGQGYFLVIGNISITGTGAGDVSAALFSDGITVLGTTATETVVAGGTANLTVFAVVRNQCCNDAKSITFVNTGIGGTVINASLMAVKL